MSAMIVAALALSPWLLWTLYVLIMGVHRARLAGRLSPVNLVMASPWILAGYAMDVLVNLTAATLLFAEWPGEWLVTSRLKRHMLSAGGWRGALAHWICEKLLDPFDPAGHHC